MLDITIRFDEPGEDTALPLIAPICLYGFLAIQCTFRKYALTLNNVLDGIGWLYACPSIQRRLSPSPSASTGSLNALQPKHPIVLGIDPVGTPIG